MKEAARLLDQEVFRKSHGKGLQWQEPLRMMQDAESFDLDNSNLPYALRAATSSDFIMDSLKCRLKDVAKELCIIIKQRLHRESWLPDADLLKPWKQFKARGEEALRKLEYKAYGKLCLDTCSSMEKKILAVKQLLQERKAQPGKVAANCKGKGRGKGKGKASSRDKLTSNVSFTNLPITKRQDILRQSSQDFAAVLTELKAEFEFFPFSEREMREVMASCAYMVAGSDIRFPWDVAYRTLCDIKASTDGRHKTVIPEFYETFDVHRAHRPAP